MSLLPNITYANPNTPLWSAAGATSAVSSFITLSASTITTSTITTNIISSQTGSISSLNLNVLDIDGQILTADPTTLFLNGVAVATESNISTLSQWALDEAISTIQANNNDLVDVRAGYFSSITANGIQTNTLTATSTIQTFNYLSTTLVNADNVSAASVVASTFNGYTVSDFLSTSPSQYDPNPLFSTITMNSAGWVSTPELFTSSINGAEFTGASGGGIQVSSLVTASISSIVGDVNLQLVSTLQFKPEFKVDFNFDLAPIGEGIKSGLTRIGVGIAGGLAAVGTGIATAALGRSQTTNIYNNSSNFEMVNTTTQLQFSTFNYEVSSIYRFVSSSGEPDLVPGEEIFVSTIIPAGAVVVRSMSDPVNLLDPSTFTSTIQSFGQWVALPVAAAVSTVSTFVDLTTESLFASTIQIGPSTILTSEPDIPGLSIRQADDFSVSQLNCSAVAIGDINSTFQGAYTYADTVDRAIVLNSSLQTKYIAYLDDLQNIQNNSISTNTLEAGKATVSSLTFTGPSTITLATTNTAGSLAQPAGRLVMTGQDLDLGFNDLWAGQVRLKGDATINQTSELLFYSPNNTQRGFNLANNDQTIRIVSTGSVQTGGYVLDTTICPPFFSSINNQVNMMAFFPSTNQTSIGVSTISIIPNYILSAFASTTQTVTAANTPTPLNHNATVVNVGGFTVLGSTITVPVAGVYEIGTSIQLDKDGGGVNIADFWFRKNGVDIPNSGSQTTVQGTNGEALATVSIFDTANPNDQYSIILASDDATMRAAYFQSTVTTPYTRPAVPAIITNIKKIG
jgi:F0F1-type ATP synthase membrane subunit c/vacuolar-type H+-ATPase subunit K